jgi:hypothetical protein
MIEAIVVLARTIQRFCEWGSTQGSGGEVCAGGWTRGAIAHHDHFTFDPSQFLRWYDVAVQLCGCTAVAGCGGGPRVNSKTGEHPLAIARGRAHVRPAAPFGDMRRRAA